MCWLLWHSPNTSPKARAVKNRGIIPQGLLQKHCPVCSSLPKDKQLTFRSIYYSQDFLPPTGTDRLGLFFMSLFRKERQVPWARRCAVSLPLTKTNSAPSGSFCSLSQSDGRPCTGSGCEILGVFGISWFLFPRSEATEISGGREARLCLCRISVPCTPFVTSRLHT